MGLHLWIVVLCSTNTHGHMRHFSSYGGMAAPACSIERKPVHIPPSIDSYVWLKCMRIIWKYAQYSVTELSILDHYTRIGISAMLQLTLQPIEIEIRHEKDPCALWEEVSRIFNFFFILLTQYVFILIIKSFKYEFLGNRDSVLSNIMLCFFYCLEPFYY